MVGEKLPPLEMDATINLADLEGDTKKLESVLGKLDPAFRKTEKGLKDVEKASKSTAGGAGHLKSTFTQLAASFTVANLASQAISRSLRGVKDAFLGSIRGAIDFEKQMVEVRKVTDASDADMKRLKKSISDMSVALGLTKEELAGVAAQAGRFGIRGVEQISKFTEVVSKMAVATDLSTDQAGEAFARLSKLLGLPIDQAENLGSAINELGNNAATSESEIVDAMLRSAGALKQLGISTPDIIALNGALNEVSESAERSGTRLRTLAFELGDPQKIEKIAEAYGLTVQQFREMLKNDPVKVIKSMGEEMKKGSRTGEQLKSVLENVSRSGLVALAQNAEGVNDALEITNTAFVENTSLQREFERAADTTSRRLASVGEAATNLGNEFGEELMPPLNMVLDGLTNQMAKAIPIAQSVGAAIGGITSAVLGLLNALPEGSISGAISSGLRIMFPKLGAVSRFLPGSGVAPKGPEGPTLGPKTLQEFMGGIPRLPVVDDEEGFSPLPPSGGGGSKDGKNLSQQISELERFRTDLLKDERERLKLRKEMGVITEKEERKLRRINDLTEFQDDKVKDATDAWKEQVKALEDVEDKIEDINEKIVEEHKKLRESLADIDEDFSKQRAETIADLLEEQKEFEEKLRLGEGLSDREQDRQKEVEELLKRAKEGTGVDEVQRSQMESERQGLIYLLAKRDLSASENIRLEELHRLLEKQKDARDWSGAFEEGKNLSELDEFGRIDADQDSNEEKAREESKARLQPLLDELAQAEENKREIEKMEKEKKKAVIDALNDRKTQSFTTYKALEERLTIHVDQQVAELNRLRNTILSLTSLETLGLGAFEAAATAGVEATARADASRFAGASTARSNHLLERAGGGPIFGPGGPTDDLIPVLASNDEHMLTAKDVRAMGGHSAVLEFRRSLHGMTSRFRNLPKFANGGPISNTDDHSYKVNLTQHFSGQHAKYASDPTLLRFHLRKR